VYNSLRIEGFLASRYFSRIPEFIDTALQWSQAGMLRHAEHVVHGMENVPAAFADLMNGRHIGKVIVEL
jgi:NADPH-dependent curcumin reductase CurA